MRRSACEKHNRANDMCAPYVEARPEGGARAEKEIGEKAQKNSWVSNSYAGTIKAANFRGLQDREIRNEIGDY